MLDNNIQDIHWMHCREGKKTEYWQRSRRAVEREPEGAKNRL